MTNIKESIQLKHSNIVYIPLCKVIKSNVAGVAFTRHVFNIEGGHCSRQIYITQSKQMLFERSLGFIRD